MADNRVAQKKCSVENCERNQWARQMCSQHYARWHAAGKPEGFEPTRKAPLFGIGDTPEERFWSRINKDGPTQPHMDTCCWEWMGAGVRYGNTVFRGVSWLTHRLAYYLHYGVHPEQLHVLHVCDHPPCCNPAHLRLGTSHDNVHDMLNKGRGKFGDQHWTHQKPECIARGERQHSAKMTAAQVVEMRKLWDEGTSTNDDLVKQFGIASSSVSKICYRQSWKHIA